MDGKICTKCMVYKPLEEYYTKTNAYSGYDTMCKSCKREYRNKYYQLHKEEILLKDKERNKANKEKKKAYQSEYYQRNKEYLCNQASLYHLNNHEKKLIYSKSYYAKNKEQMLAKKKERNISCPEIAKSNKLIKYYGLTYHKYCELLDLQGGKCAICGSVEVVVDKRTNLPRRLSVDHDHSTGRIRGLLCNACNAGIGRLKDNPELLMRAAEYLLSYREGNT